MDGSIAYDTRMESPQSDGLVGAFDMQLDRLDEAIARLQMRLTDIIGPDHVERAAAVPVEELTPARKRVVRLGDLIDSLIITTNRLDI